ncbi:MAG: flagellar biosynthetic protein FliR [Defluviitaleaceae bacterium]|nr:flagellar biosynthetic protein FliR [Defluviitaleaceae bacterium]
MDIAASQTLMELYLNVDVFMAVFVRVMGFFIVMPIMSGQNIPVPLRLVFSIAMALLAFVSNSVTLPAYDPTIWSFGVLLLQEFMIGLILGLVIMMIFSIFHFVGQLADFQMGFSMAYVMDPFGGGQMPVTGNFYYLVISMLFIATGALQFVIGVFFSSFGELGLGAAFVADNATLAAVFVEITVSYFRTGFGIALPIVGTIMVVNFVLGILVKAVPQMNVFVVGMPIKVIVGLVIVFVSLPFLANAFENIFIEIVQYMEAMIIWMQPEAAY